MSNNKRYEYKYVIHNTSIQLVKHTILMHPLSFSPIYTPRWINNIYFDTADRKSYFENIDGASKRVKYRVRWYGENHKNMINPILEIKHKDSELGWKDHISLNGKLHGSRLNDLVGSQIPELSEIYAAVQNRYFRHYFLSLDKRFRITIDERLGHKIPNTNQAFIYEDKLIVELKFEAESSQMIEEVLKYLPWRQRKNSKFAQGIQIIAD